MHQSGCRLKIPLTGGGFILENNLQDKETAESILHLCKLENPTAFIKQENE